MRFYYYKFWPKSKQNKTKTHEEETKKNAKNFQEQKYYFPDFKFEYSTKKRKEVLFILNLPSDTGIK